MTKLRARPWQLTAIFIAGMALRLALALVVPPAHDLQDWRRVAAEWEAGHSPYEGTHVYHYAPPWFWVIGLVTAFTPSTSPAFPFAIRLVSILADAAIFWLLIAGSRHLQATPRTTFITAGTFAFSPVALQTTGYFGQFDNLSVLFALWAWYAWSGPVRGRWWWTMAALNLSVAMKHFTVLLIPIFAAVQQGWARRLATLLGGPGLFLGTLLPYLVTEPTEVLHDVFGHNLHAGYWGWSGILCRSILFFTGSNLIQQPWFRSLDHANWLVYLAIVVVSFWIAKRVDLLDGILLTFLLFYTFTTQMAPQYTVWLLPFAALRPNRYFYTYSVIGGVQLAAFAYAHYHWFHHLPFVGTIPNLIPETFVICRYLTWAVGVWWLAHLVRKTTDGPIATHGR